MRISTLVPLAALSITLAHAQAPLTAIGTSTVIDFSTTVVGVNQGAFAASTPIGNTSPIDGQLDFDAWNYTTDAAQSTATQSAANFPGAVPNGNGIGTAGSLTAGISAVDVNAQRALAIQPAANHWTSGSITLRAQNNTAGSIEQVDVSYVVYVWNDADRGNDVRFYYSLSAAQDSWVEITDARVVSAAAPVLPASWVANPVSFSLSGFSINPGDIVYLRWVGNDVDGSNTRDEFALDDISLTPQTATGPLVITSVTGLPPFTQVVGTPSAEQNFIVVGNNLTGNATVTAPAPYQVSLAQATGYGTSVVIPQTSGVIAPTTVYARLNSGSAGTFNGVITVSSPGAGNALVGVSGVATGTSLPELYINEVLANNVADTTDENGDHDEWFEIFNPGDDAVDLGGWFVTDDLLTLANYQFPPGGALAIVPAHGFLLVWTDNEPQEGDLHTSFGLNSAGGWIGLVAPDGNTIVDSISYDAAAADVSFGREFDGQEPWIDFSNTTPGSTNHPTGINEVGGPNALHAWPSPAVDRLFVSQRFTGDVLTIEGTVVMQLRNASSIDVHGLPAGSYVLRSSDGRTMRFVKGK